MEVFSSRELASIIWFAALFFWMLSKPDLLNGIKSVLKALLALRLVFVFEALAVYLLGLVYVLTQFFTWELDQAKAAILWYLFVGAPLVFKAVDAEEGYNPLKVWWKTTFTFVIVVEFLISKYTLPLVAELFLLPILTLVVMMVAYSETKEEYKQVHTLLSWVLGVMGVWLLSMSVSQFIANSQTDFSLATLKELSLPILLSLLTLPFFYGLHIYSSYERAFSTLKVWADDDDFRKEMRWSAIFAFGLDVRTLMRWKRLSFEDKPENYEELRRTIDEAKRVAELERRPPKVLSENGWSPYVAKRFLADNEVTTGDYREYGGRWHADSRVITIRRGVFSNFLVYMVEGSEIIADTLRLKLTLNNQGHRDEDLSKHREYVNMLLVEAMSASFVDAFNENVGDEAEFDFAFENFEATQSLEVITAPNLTIEEYDFRLAKK